MEPATLSKRWSIGEKIAFRFLFIYFLLYTFPFPLVVFPFVTDFNFTNLWSPLVIWSAKNILKLDYEITVLPNGSGDTTWNYIKIMSYDSGTVYHFRYEKERNTYFLRGTLYSDTIRITMKKVSNDFPLVDRGFHWINEYPLIVRTMQCNTDSIIALF